MASIVFNIAKSGLMDGTIDLDSHDIRVALLMTNNDVANEKDENLMNALTLDEMDGANYARAALANEAVSTDDANDRGEFDADDVTFSSLGNGTREVAGALVYKHVTDDTDSIPICWVEFASTVNPGGGNLTIQWNAEGILQLTD